MRGQVMFRCEALSALGAGRKNKNSMNIIILRVCWPGRMIL